jgi:hypothetical protein
LVYLNENWDKGYANALTAASKNRWWTVTIAQLYTQSTTTAFSNLSRHPRATDCSGNFTKARARGCWPKRLSPLRARDPAGLQPRRVPRKIAAKGGVPHLG